VLSWLPYNFKGILNFPSFFQCKILLHVKWINGFTYQSTIQTQTLNGGFFDIYQLSLLTPVRNDILRKHGIIPEKPPSPTPIIQEALVEAAKRAHENRLQGKDLDELDELEDEEDEVFLEKYRKERMAELSRISKESVYGQVYPLQKPDYSHDVTEASKNVFVLVNLTSSLGTNIESRLLTELWSELARKFGEIKFCEMRADLCIEGYPERNTPTILIYKDGDIKKQIVTLRELHGQRTSIDGISHLARVWELTA
jgi:hypothetical protein